MSDVQPEARIPANLTVPAVVAVADARGGWEYWTLQDDGTWIDQDDVVTIFRDGTQLGWYIGRDRWLLLTPHAGSGIRS